jgi:hypothetical protein
VASNGHAAELAAGNAAVAAIAGHLAAEQGPLLSELRMIPTTGPDLQYLVILILPPVARIRPRSFFRCPIRQARCSL